MALPASTPPSSKCNVALRFLWQGCPLSSGVILRPHPPGGQVGEGLLPCLRALCVLLSFLHPFRQNKAVHPLPWFADDLPSRCPSNPGWNGPLLTNSPHFTGHPTRLRSWDYLRSPQVMSHLVGARLTSLVPAGTFLGPAVMKGVSVFFLGDILLSKVYLLDYSSALNGCEKGIIHQLKQSCTCLGVTQVSLLSNRKSFNYIILSVPSKQQPPLMYLFASGLSAGQAGLRPSPMLFITDSV